MDSVSLWYITLICVSALSSLLYSETFILWNAPIRHSQGSPQLSRRYHEINTTMESIYFIYQDQLYRQTRVAPMWSPIIANILMAQFKQKAIELNQLKLSCWYQYINIVFIVWPHGKDSLYKFHQHINNSYNIHFTVEIKENSALPYLGVLIS